MNLLAVENPSVLFVCLLGVGVVFAGLVCIVGILEIMNFICSKFAKKTSGKSAISEGRGVEAPIENREEILAAVCAAVAEENGTDISAIRVLSFKKL